MKKIISTGLFLFILFSLFLAEAGAKERSWLWVDQSPQKTLMPKIRGLGWYPRTNNDSSLSSTGYYTAKETEDLFQMPGEFGEKKEGMKSVTKAAILSFLLPGAGEFYGGAGTKGRIFIFSEASAWVGYFGFQTYGNWLEDDYKTYAASHARVILPGKPDGFFDQLAFYDTRDMYNQMALLYHRGEVQAYPEDDLWNWEWESKESRLYYRELKNRSKDASRRALYMVGLSIVNRIISVVDAMKTVQTYNRKKSFEMSHIKFDLQVNPLSHNPRFMLYVSRRW